MKRKVFPILLVLLLIFTALSGCSNKAPRNITKKAVTIVNKSSYYEVTLNFSGTESHRKIGEEYASEILKLVPNYEFLVDSYIQETIGSDDFYNTVLSRVNDIKPQISREYRDELEGMASKFSGHSQNKRGDGKISLDELYLFNLFDDVVRNTQCSAFGVFGSRSATGHAIAARILDWYDGSTHQLSYIQAVTTFNNSSKSICTIGYLGYIGVITGFNDNKVFAAILSSDSKKPYSSETKHSYSFDLRYALENSKTLDSAADYLKSPDRNYAFSFLIFFSDPETCKVLENNISSGPGSIRGLRTSDSVLNTGAAWGIDDSIGCVNCFLLKGNPDNYSGAQANTARWSSIKKGLLSAGNPVSAEDMKKLAAFHISGSKATQEEGNIYNCWTQQMIIFQPGSFDLQVFFRPKYGSLPDAPYFNKISVKFASDHK